MQMGVTHQTGQGWTDLSIQGSPGHERVHTNLGTRLHIHIRASCPVGLNPFYPMHRRPERSRAAPHRRQECLPQCTTRRGDLYGSTGGVQRSVLATPERALWTMASRETVVSHPAQSVPIPWVLQM